MSSYIGGCFLKIAEKLSHMRKFILYPFREDMVMDGVLCCVKYANNFDPNKTENAFGYFTQIVYYAFIQRIMKEKAYLYTKYKLIQHAEIFDEMADFASSNAGDVDSGYSDNAADNMHSFIENFESWLDKKGKNYQGKKKKNDLAGPT